MRANMAGAEVPWGDFCQHKVVGHAERIELPGERLVAIDYSDNVPRSSLIYFVPGLTTTVRSAALAGAGLPRCSAEFAAGGGRTAPGKITTDRNRRG